MKKYFVCMLAVCALAAGGCGDSLEIGDAAVGAGTESEVEESRIVYVEIGATAAEGAPQTAAAASRASVDADLQAYWEEGDRIKVLQGYAGNWISSTSASADVFSLTAGAGSVRGCFGGEIAERGSDAQYFHLASPAENCELTVSKSRLSSTQTTTCRITVPAKQTGRWTPYLWSSTTEKLTAETLPEAGIGFHALTGALAVRVYESDRKTPKAIRSIEITADTELVGVFTAATTEAFSASDFVFEGSGRTVGADGLDAIEPLNGLYEYRLNVAPVSVARLDMRLVDTDGAVVTRTAGARTFTANHRTGFNVYWDDASVTFDGATSWFEEYASDEQTTLEGGTLYVSGVKVAGAALSQLVETGVEIDGVRHASAVPSAAFDMKVPSLASGALSVNAYAELADGSVLRSDVRKVTVTAVPSFAGHTIRSSYTANGADGEKTNELDGDKIYAQIALNDRYVQENLIASALLHCGGTATTIASDAQTATDALAWGVYDCRIEVVLTNGYRLSTPVYATAVTGIPYSISFNSSDYATDAYVKEQMGWSAYNYGYYTASDQALTLNGSGSESKRGYAVSPQFHVPAAFSIAASVKGYLYAFPKTTCTIRVGATVDRATRSPNPVSTESIGSSASLTSNGTTRTLEAFDLSPAAPFLSIYNDCSTAGAYFRLTEFHVEYAE